jgi:hypothetical protein
MTQPYNTKQFNIGHSVFPGFNDKQGLVICGYEWGHSKNDQAIENDPERHQAILEHLDTIHTFASKAWDSPYDRRIMKWFRMFGHPLGQESGQSDFDKTILQTNWSDDQGQAISDYEKFLAPTNVDNFLGIMREFEPSLMIFLGIGMMNYLNAPEVRPKFLKIFGNETQELVFKRNDDFEGKKFRLGFQKFERCNIIALPHPSGTIGLSDSYIELFADKIGGAIRDFKASRFQRIPA